MFYEIPSELVPVFLILIVLISGILGAVMTPPGISWITGSLVGMAVIVGLAIGLTVLFFISVILWEVLSGNMFR